MNKAELAELTELAWEAIRHKRNPYSQFSASPWRDLSHDDQCAMAAGIAAVADRILVEVRASIRDTMSDSLQPIIEAMETKLRKVAKENTA